MRPKRHLLEICDGLRARSLDHVGGARLHAQPVLPRTLDLSGIRFSCGGSEAWATGGRGGAAAPDYGGEEVGFVGLITGDVIASATDFSTDKQAG
jgi:hypothetical protein